MTRIPARLASALLTAAAAANLAHAQCDIYKLDVPDFDQRRSPAGNIPGLPWGGGSHCVPSSLANWIGFINNHGYPYYFDGGVQNWELGTYIPVTYMIYDLGQLMGTTENGTNMSDGIPGLQSYLDEQGTGLFVASNITASGGDAPLPSEMLEAMEDGQLATLGTSRWLLTPASNGHPQRYVRTKGGHAQSVIRVYNACTASPTIYTRDPAGDEGNPFNQSTFANTSIFSQLITAWYAKDDTSAPVWRTMCRLNPAADYFSAISDVTLITPKVALTGQAQLGQLKFNNTHSPSDFSIKPPHTHALPGGPPILSAKQHPQLNRAIAVAQTAPGVGTLFEVRPSGPITPIGTVADPGPCVFGRNGEFFIVSGNTVQKHTKRHNGITSIDSFSFGGGASAMTYDDTTDHLVLICASRGAVGSCMADNPRGFGTDYAEVPLPAATLLAGDVFAACSPVDGSLYLASAASPAIHRLTKMTTGGYDDQAILLPAIQCCPRFLNVDHREHLSFIVDGIVHEFRRNAAGGGWEADPSSLFAGLNAGDLFEVNSSRAMTDDTLTPETEGQTVPPPNETTAAFPDCRADFNASGTVTVQDIFDFLAEYFGGSLNADFNQSGQRTVQDLFNFLAAYFAGCA